MAQPQVQLNASYQIPSIYMALFVLCNNSDNILPCSWHLPITANLNRRCCSKEKSISWMFVVFLLQAHNGMWCHTLPHTSHHLTWS